MSLYYKGVEDIIKDQYAKGLLTVDFQAMLDMRACPECNGAKLRKESLNVFLIIEKEKDTKKYNIATLQNIPLGELVILIENFKEQSTKDKTLVQRITHPLIDRARTCLLYTSRCV